MQNLSRVTTATVDVIRTLSDSAEPLWGLLIIKSISRPPGSVYPILERLERSGWVTSRWEDDTDRSGPRRRLYELTDAGAEAAQSLIAEFDRRRLRAAPKRATGEVTA